MPDQYANKKSDTVDSGWVKSKRPHNWYPEIIEPEDVGRKYPPRKSLTFGAALRRWLRGVKSPIE